MSANFIGKSKISLASHKPYILIEYYIARAKFEIGFRLPLVM